MQYTTEIPDCRCDYCLEQWRKQLHKAAKHKAASLKRLEDAGYEKWGKPKT